MGTTITGYNEKGPYNTDKILASVFDEDKNEIKVNTELTVDGVTIDNIDIEDISAGTQTNDVKITMDGEEVTVNATDLDVRDLTSVSDSVEVLQDTASDLNMTEANSGDILTSVQLIDDSIATTDSAGTSKNTQIGLVAESTIPTEVGDGDSVPVWADTFGRQVMAGFSQAINSLNVQESSPAQLLTLESTNLDAVTATGAGADIDVSNYNKITVAYTASSVTTGGTVDLEGSMDGTSYYTIDSEAITDNGTTYHSISGEKHKYIRTNLSSRTDGTYTTKIIAGN